MQRNLLVGKALSPQSTEKDSDHGGQAGWNSLPAIASGSVFYTGKITVSYVSPAEIAAVQKTPLPADWALEAPTTRFPSTCFEVGYKYYFAGSTLTGEAYVYDYCKPGASSPGTYVAAIPDSVIASFASGQAWNDGATTYGYSIMIYSEDEKTLNVFLDNGNEIMEIASSSGAPVSEPESADAAATGWSYLETAYVTAPEVCPRLPDFYGQGMYWAGVTPDHSRITSQSPTHLNTSTYKYYSAAPYNECVINDKTTGYHYFANYYTSQRAFDDEWRVQSLSS